MPTEPQRTIKVSAKAYKMLSDESEKEGKTMGEIASSILSAALEANMIIRTATTEATDVTYTNPYGERYDPKTGKRVFPR